METRLEPVPPASAAPSSVVRAATRSLRVLSGGMLAGAVALPRLPPIGPLCVWRRLTGVPCPTCGMTTAVVALAHGDPLGALGANPAVAVLVAAVLVAWLPAAARKQLGRRVPVPAVSSRVVAGSVPLLLAPLWLFELHRYDVM